MQYRKFSRFLLVFTFIKDTFPDLKQFYNKATQHQDKVCKTHSSARSNSLISSHLQSQKIKLRTRTHPSSHKNSIPGTDGIISEGRTESSAADREQYSMRRRSQKAEILRRPSRRRRRRETGQRPDTEFHRL